MCFTVSSCTWFQFLGHAKFITILEIGVMFDIGSHKMSRNHALFLAFVSVIMLASIFQTDFLHKSRTLAADSSRLMSFQLHHLR